MPRTLSSAILIVACITLFSGCTMSTRPAGLLSRFSNPSDEEEFTEESGSRWAERSAPEDSEISALLASHEEQAAASEPAAQDPPGLDAATLFLIESELRDVPAPERARWMAYLQTVDPKTVPYVLQARRMSVDAPGSQPGAQPAPAPGFNGSIQPHVAGTAGTSAPQSQPASGGAMSQMRLDAPEPAGTSMVINPAGQPARSQEFAPQQPAYPNQPPTPTPQPVEQSLPTISPGTHGHLADGTMNDDAVTRTNYESGGDLSNQPLAAGRDAYLREALQRVIALTEAEVASLDPGYTEQERMDYLRRQVALRMLYFMSEQPHLAQQAIPEIGQADQEFWTELFWAVSDYFDVGTTPDPSERTALTAAQLASATDHLRHQARLELWNTSFSHKITSFGNFERYDRDEFRAGQPVLLYAELRNFNSEPTNSGHFRTQLKSHIEIRRGGVDGERIEYNSFPPTEDLCRSPRNDYFHSYKIELPHNLTPGPYALVLTVEDMLSGKVATQVLDFAIR